MGILKYAILGMLYRNDMTGYELKKAFESTLFEFCRLGIVRFILN